MSEWKDQIRLSFGLIQQRNGNNNILSFLTDVMASAFMKTPEGKLWLRNSYVYDAHIPLLSDLDLTLINASTETARALHSRRKYFLLIGEINFYHPKIVKELLALANPFELKRDPALIEHYSIKDSGTEIQKTVFLARQLQSDQKWLRTFPEVRKKKWDYLCKILSLKSPDIPENKYLSKLIANPAVRKDLSDFLELTKSPHEIYSLASLATWKYLFPNFHIWSEKDDEYLSSLNEEQLEILREQIKWEFWGVGCHFYWLEQQVAINHLERMLKVYKKINPSAEDLKAMETILNFIRL